MIGTLRKAWRDEAAPCLSMLGFLMMLIMRPRMEMGNYAAAVSCALGVAHLFPVLLKCEPTHEMT